MLSENIKAYRKAKGLSQQELAIKLNVVRQTVSKWEKGLSVPDSEMLLLLAETLDVSVSMLLGEAVSSEQAPTLQSLAEKLETLNEQFAERSEKTRKIWRIIFWISIAVASVVLLFELTALVFYLISTRTLPESEAIGIIGGADGPTAIFVARETVDIPPLLLAAAALILSAVGLRRTK